MIDQLDNLYDKTDMALLAAGGKDALACFVQLSRRVLEGAGETGLRNLVIDILPLLPPVARAELVVLLFTTLVDDRQARKKAMPNAFYSLH